MLHSFRNASKSWVVKLLLVLVALSFVSWGVGDVVNNGLFGRGPAIQVGEVEVPAAAVEAEFRREVERLQPLFGGKLTSEDARKLGLLDRTIDTIVTRTLIDEAARDLGLAASEDAVVAQVAADPNFRNQAGQFDRDLLRRALARAGLTEAEFLRMERSNLVRGQMAEALSGGLAAPKLMVEPLVRWRQEQRVAETVVVRNDSIPLPAAPDAATLEKFYQENAKTRFMAPEYRALTVLMLQPGDVAKDIEITPEAVHEAYQSRLAEFVTPERRQVSQVVLPDQAAADKAAELVKAGRDLPAIAKELNLSVVDLGAVEKQDLPDELAETVFAQKQGAVTAPVKTALGWHVARINAVTPGRTRTEGEVAGQLEQDLRRERSLDRLHDLATQVEDTLGGGATLEETAAKFRLKTVKIPAIDAQGRGAEGKPVDAAPKAETFLETAFQTESGTESQLLDNAGEGYFLVRVDQVTPPQPRKLADIRPEVVAAWQAQRRQELAEERARKLAEELKAGKGLAEASQGLKVRTSEPFTRDDAEAAGLPGPVVADLFQGQPGAVAVAPTQNGWMVARLSRIIPFDPAAQPQVLQGGERRISSTVAADLVDQYIAALNADLGVKVDRSQLSREE